MSFLPSKEQVERWKHNPIEFLKHLAQTEGFQVPPHHEAIFKHYFRGGDMSDLQPKPELRVVNITFEPRKGWSLMSLFNEHVFKHYGKEDDDVEFDASDVHFFVNGNGFPYSTIMDFKFRLPDIKALPGFGDITLIYDEPEALSDIRLNSDVMRALRTFESKEKWTNEDGSMLSTECIIDVIQQLHLRVIKHPQ